MTIINGEIDVLEGATVDAAAKAMCKWVRAGLTTQELTEAFQAVLLTAGYSSTIKLTRIK